MSLPADMLRHQVEVEPYEGPGPAGPLYGDAVTYRGYVEDNRRLVRSATGDEVVSETTVYLDPGAVIPAESRVTLPSGRRAFVITVATREGPPDPGMDHLEVTLT
ncbi:hypothetical protein FLW53_23465 [Microbispora sp. SCL1-1]|uniref:hypothetical protein n=1 Tax=unclassified Microbispora TaxID=2614687 RepID=UPI00115AD148|nr:MULTISPECIES: hypothetical protein [unclassified Microbispora]NJP27104.1 hypothetical protein [Microbispora sp. CL1-1]TQS11449.1 hypothetical protein FLW53_23465 [Microbispora sp. SCL1-1]